MPPKPNQRRGEDVDISDISTLPKANVTVFQVIFSKFRTTDTRQKITDYVNKNFGDDRVKTLNRQEIIDYGKGKGIIEDGASPDSTPKEGQLSYQQMLAQSAADRIFELNLAVRKTKKEKLTKLEEEAAAKAAEGTTPAEKPELDNDIVDALFYMPDFPSTEAEALALSQYGYSINCLFEIFQIQENLDGSAPNDPEHGKEVDISDNQAEADYFKNVTAQLDELKHAIAVSSKNAPIRNCAIFRVPFCNAEVVEYKENEEGEQQTTTLPAEQAFMKTFVSEYVEKYGSFFINYQKFIEQTEVLQLMPDKEVMQELRELKRAHVQYEQWKADREASKRELAEQQAAELNKEGLSQEEKDDLANQNQESLHKIDSEMDTQKEQDQKNQGRIQELLQLSKRSIDEERDKKTHFSREVYDSDFIPDKESMNTVPSIVSAMVSQIAEENASRFMDSSNMDKSTEPETLDDIFDQYYKEISYDTNLMERDPPEEPQQYMGVKGILPKDINVYETFDTSTKPVQTLPAGIVDERKAQAMRISEREKNAASNLVLPGCNRYMMPDVPSKSQRLRDAENPQFYPFSTLPIEDAERTMQLKAFQQLIKSSGIDEAAKPGVRAPRCKIFERKYDEYFEPEIFRQVLQNSLLKNPDLATMYYPRSDQLLLILYNKINNSKRSSENLEKYHGVKPWRSAYRVVPNFQSWIEFFGGNSVIQQMEYKPKDPTDPPVKYILDEEMVPPQMLDVDDNRVKNIKQTFNQFFPDDNSIMTSEEYEIGGDKKIKAYVYKDQLEFGLRQNYPEGFQAAQEQFGLVSYKSVGDHQFWLNFSDHETKIMVETIEANRNAQKLIEIKPPEPTPEEIAAKEEAAKAAAAKQKKDKKEVVEVQEEKEPEPVWEEGPPDFLDGLFKDHHLGHKSQGPCTTTTLKNGLMVRHMHNGDIVQIRDSSLQDRKPHTEIDRVHLFGGLIIRHFHNLDCEILWPNGDFAKFERAEMKWTVTNDKGFRREFKDGIYKDLSKINCLNQTDPKTGICTKVREDKVVLIRYEDGSLYCQHADGTQIFSQEDGKQIRIEKDGFAPVMYQETAKGRDLEEWLETEDIKSLNGMMTMVFLPDKSVVQSIQFFKSSEQTTRKVTKHLFLRDDFSSFMLDSDGDFRVISTEARSAINDDDERARLGNDVDYLKQMYQPNGEYTPGIYYGCISADPSKVHIACRDSERPFYYVINSEFKLEKRSYTQFEENTDWKPIENKQDFEADRDIEYVGVGRNPYQRSFIFPRMFIINPNGNALELLSQDQIDMMIKFNQNKNETLTTSRIEYVENTQMNSIQVLNKVTSIQENQLANQKMSKLDFPEYSWPYILPHRSEEEVKNLKPLQDQYHYRNITEFCNFEPLKQNAFIEDYLRFNEWKQSQIRYDTEFGIVHVAPKDGSLDLDEIEDNEFYAKRINLKILNERSTLREKDQVGRDVFKINFCKAYNIDDEIVSFRKKMTTVEREEQEIQEEIERRKRAEVEKQVEMENQQKEEQLAMWRDKKKDKARVKFENRIKEYNYKKETPTFASQYHKSRQGIEYFKVNPVKPPSDEMLMRMSQRINRSQQNTEKGQSMFEQNSQKSGGLPKENEDKNNPIVALEPEEMKQASLDKSKKFTSASKQTGDEKGEPGEVGMSLYMQEKIYLKQLEQEKILKAEEHHVIKTKDFNVYGKLRQDKPFVKSTVKSQVQSELNEKFITTECITDRRVKISSMANRQYINAPSVEDVRKQGQHQMILQAINKKQTFSELINQANSMVTSVLHDGLKRSVNILPSSAKFGAIKQGENAEMILTIKNEDSLSQRILVKPLADQRIEIKQETYGPIAPGMIKKIIVIIHASSTGKIKEDIQIATKSDIFKIPVEANILSAEEFVGDEAKTNSRVKTRLRSSIAQSRKQSVMEQFKAQQALEAAEKNMLLANQQTNLGPKKDKNDSEEWKDE